MMTPEKLKELITAHIANADVTATDANNDGVYLGCTVISPAFEGKPLIARHRMVHKALGDAFDGPIHSLQISALTPQEKEQQNDA